MLMPSHSHSSGRTERTTYAITRSSYASSYVDARVIIMLVTIGMLVVTTPAWAGGVGGADMPWNAPLQTVLSNLTGPTGRALAALMFVIGGAVWGFTRHEEGAKKFGQAIFGIAVMLGAVQIVGVLAFAGAMI